MEELANFVWTKEKVIKTLQKNLADDKRSTTFGVSKTKRSILFLITYNVAFFLPYLILSFIDDCKVGIISAIYRIFQCI